MAASMQHLVSHPTSTPLLMTSSPLPSPLIVTSHPDHKGLTPLLALLFVLIHDALLTTYALLPSHLSADSHHDCLKLSQNHQIILNSENFYCRNGVLATNIISTASTPHQRCQHPTKGALLLAQAKWTRKTSSASFYRCLSSPFLRPPLCYQANSSQDCPWESHHLLALSKSVCYSK